MCNLFPLRARERLLSFGSPNEFGGECERLVYLVGTLMKRNEARIKTRTGKCCVMLHFAYICYIDQDPCPSRP